MTESRFPDAPSRIKQLFVDKRGFPVPAFVRWIDGQPDFRVMDPTHLNRCVKFKRCWICGDQMGVHKAFVIGPMCCINRVSAEPPSHYECARFAVETCPFMTSPLAKRGNLDDIEHHSAGVMIERNPGVSAIWMTRTYTHFRAGPGLLFEIGEPDRIEFYAKGRVATHEEIMHSITTGLPLLADAARKEGVEAMKAYVKTLDRFEKTVGMVIT